MQAATFVRILFGLGAQRPQEYLVESTNALKARRKLSVDDDCVDHVLSQTVARVRGTGGVWEACAGRFCNYLVSGTRSVEMRATWLVTTRLPETALVIRALLGGEAPIEYLTHGAVHVSTAADKAAIVVDSVDSIRFDMKQWIDGRLAHHCDTRFFLFPAEREGAPCGCPTSIAELKARALADRGPRPDIRIRFRLAAAPELGDFEYRTSGWTLLTDGKSDLHTLLSRLMENDGPTACSLGIELVEYTTRLGRGVAFPRVRLAAVGASGPASGV
ncbi:hypothetical protein [Streptacidiphilus anmyonensis]|uniref:hypothetical protein n=1 Tax=Streptacidiphilus anmyonensis TaxID=405782 RepID=UPI000693EAF4|nr:hypothetical protein [Streptacidiphilus anmyonensis]